MTPVRFIGPVQHDPDADGLAGMIKAVGVRHSGDRRSARFGHGIVRRERESVRRW
jgi:hypothetical protein